MDDGRYDKGVLVAHIECYNYHPTQNCTHPKKIRLHVEGGDHQHDIIAKALRNLTALPQKCKDNSGEVVVPLTWAIVTQCAQLMAEYEQTWQPDLGLITWIKDEFM